MRNLISFQSVLTCIFFCSAVLFSANMQAQTIFNTNTTSNHPSGTFGNTASTPAFPTSSTPHYSYKVATCPFTSNHPCSDNQLVHLMDFAGPYNTTIGVAPNFVLLLDINPGDLSWLMILAENGSNPIDILNQDISSPQNHNLYDNSLWLVRINVHDLMDRGLYVDASGYLTINVVGALHDGTNVRESLKFKVRT